MNQDTTKSRSAESSFDLEAGARETSPALPQPLPPPSPPSATYAFHPAFYVITWISLSSAVILFNKHILFTLKFEFPILLTTWHLIFATAATQLLARTTTLLDGRKSVPMTGRTYTRAIAPIGFFFSLSLICGNKAYLYLSVSFIQMLKATTPVFVLFTTWALSLEAPNYKVLANVAVIVFGVMIASWGEIAFNMAGFIYQVMGIGFEATRLVMVQRLLSAKEYKMDPLVSLYYFAPVCAVLNFLLFLGFEAGAVTWADVEKVGIIKLILNAGVAFALNVSVVFLIGKTSSLVLTLCGVLKDLLLVAASMLIWRDPVTFLQFFGYSIALAGLVWYKLGGEKLKEYAMQFQGEVAKDPKKRIGAYAVGAVLFMVLLWCAFGAGSNGDGVPAAATAAEAAKQAVTSN